MGREKLHQNSTVPERDWLPMLFLGPIAEDYLAWRQRAHVSAEVLNRSEVRHSACDLDMLELGRESALLQIRMHLST